MFIMCLMYYGLRIKLKNSKDSIDIGPSEIIEIDEDVVDMDKVYEYAKMWWIDILEDQRMTRFELMELGE